MALRRPIPLFVIESPTVQVTLPYVVFQTSFPRMSRRAFNTVKLKPQPCHASCQDGFPSGASVFRLA